jgi:hypothetical protein
MLKGLKITRYVVKQRNRWRQAGRQAGHFLHCRGLLGRHGATCAGAVPLGEVLNRVASIQEHRPDEGGSKQLWNVCKFLLDDRGATFEGGKDVRRAHNTRKESICT